MKTHRHAFAVTIALGTLAFAACGGTDSAEPPTTSVEPATTVDPTPTADDVRDTTNPASPVTTDQPTPTTVVEASTTTEPAPLPAPTVPITTTTTIAPDPVPALPAGFTVVVPLGGPDGLTYTEDLSEEVRYGPDLISVDDLGGVHISDPLADRIVSFRGGQTTSFDLAAVGATSPLDFIAADDRFIILDDGGGAPQVIVVSYTGELLDQIAVPEGYRLEDGLQGLIDTGDDSRIVLELLVPKPGTYVEWHADEEQWLPTNSLNLDRHVVDATEASITVDGLELPVEATPNNEFWASLRFATMTDTGGVLTLRWDGTSSIEWWSSDGQFVGAAALPTFQEQTIEEAATEFAVTGDGRVFALLTGPDSVTVTEILPGPERIITP